MKRANTLSSLKKSCQDIYYNNDLNSFDIS